MNLTASSDPKVILITGASTGFGHDTAQTLHRAGHRVFATMRETSGRNRVHAEALRNLSIEVLELDVTDQGSVDKAVAQLLSQAGRIDVLVNNAGIASAGVSESFTTEQVKALFDVNVFGVMRATRAVLPTMRAQRRGLVINVGSILGRVTFPFFGIYGASKFALEAWNDSLRYELSGLGVEVALVQPSAYPTPMYSSVQHPAEPAVALAYGKTGDIPGTLFQHFLSVFAGVDAPDLHDVAVAISKLVAAPAGQRAARTIVGAFTGDLSAEMLKDAGATAVLVGHSERRQSHGETDAMVAAKAGAGLRAGLSVVICIGETLAQRQGGQALTTCGDQIAGSLHDGLNGSNCAIGYEPLWAIGSGQVPMAAQITEMHAHIRRCLVARLGAHGDSVRILYGGSVKPDNARAILALPQVGGALVGGASLEALSFQAIERALP